MSERGAQGLGPVPRTLMAPLWARAIETKRASPILSDWSAVTTAGSLDFDFGRLHLPRSTVAGACARTALIDEMVRECCRMDPRLMLVNLGEGLDNRFGRVDNGAISCVDLDLPEVVDLRARFFPDTRRRRAIARSALNYEWMDEIGSGFDAVVFVAEGVLMYLRMEEVRELFARVAVRFPGAQIIFDSIAPPMVRFARMELGRGFDARFQWGVRHAAEMERWGRGYKLMERRSVFETHRRHFGFLMRSITRVIPAALWIHSVNRFRLGG